MNDLIVQVSKGYRTVIPAKTFIGNDGENLQTKLIFTFLDEFINGVGRLEVLIDNEKSYIPLIKDKKTYYLPIKNVMTKVGNIELQLVITEPENENGIPLYKSDIFKLYCKDSINAVEEAPEGYDLWIDIANAKIIEIDEKIVEVNKAIVKTNNLNISVSKTDGTTSITLTKKDGTKDIVKVYDGATGNGIESITKTSTSGLVDTYTILYTDGTSTTFDVTNGEDGTDGRGIVSITKTSTVGYVDTYTITYTDNTTSTFEVTNGEVSQAQFDRAMMVYNALPKVTDTDTQVILNGTANTPMQLELNPSELTQETTPTPDNPSEVQVIKGNNSIKIENKNLFDKTTITNQYRLGTSGELYSDNSYSASDYIRIKPQTTYTYSRKETGGEYSAIAYYDSDKNFISRILPLIITSATSGNRTSPANAKYCRICDLTTVIDEVQLEEGSTATTFVAHQEQVLPLNLPNGMEYCKIGDYEDEFEHDGDKWYLNKYIGKKILNGTETWNLQNVTSGKNYYTFITGALNQTSVPIYSNILTYRYFNSAESNVPQNVGFISTGRNLNFLASQFNDVSALTTFLATTNMIVYYVLATPTHIEITDTTLISQLNAIEQAVSYDEQTNISQTNAQLPFRIKASAVRSLVNIFNTISGGE